MTSPLWMPLIALVIATGLINAVAQETRPALQEQVASEYADAAARLQAAETRLTAALDDAQKTQFAAAQQKWLEYRDAAVALALTVIKPQPEQADYFRFLELNKLTRDRISSLERLSAAASAQTSK
jgi:uncharacterized protein YecT (DUF1311 family)